MDKSSRISVGLTGDIGSGKSTVLQMFQDLGFATASADALVHKLLQEDLSLIDQISGHFGSGVLNRSGGIDRKALGQVVFADDAKRIVLERLVHPRVRTCWEAIVQDDQNPRSVIEIPLLFEKKLEKQFNHSVSIFCSFDVKLRRLRSRGMSDSAAKSRLDVQMNQTDKLNRADFLILNNGSLNYLRCQVKQCVAMMQNR